MNRSARILFTAALALAAALGDSCSCGNRCAGVSCATGEACDPADGQCKCGGAQGSGNGTGGVVCGSGEKCDPNLQACVSSLCDAVSCSNGNGCDPADGKCKCGGVVCAPDELCDQSTHDCQGTAACAGVLCPGGTSCDPLDGLCKCGVSVCDGGEICADAGCVADPCFGVFCPGSLDGGGGNSCFGGLCHCGGPDGPICDTGQSCATASKSCQPSELCQGVSCEPGAICGPADGLCHCGGVSGPVCGGGATCVLYGLDAGPPLPADAGLTDGGIVGRCLGGNLCAGVACPEGESCDPTSGACLCGATSGSSGFACGPGQICESLPGWSGPGCLTPCNPYAQPPFQNVPSCPKADGGAPDAAVPEACYLEPDASVVICERSGPGTDGAPCGIQSDCAPGFGCFPPPADAGTSALQCWAFCDSFDGGIHTCLGFGRQCVGEAEIAQDGGLVQVGACFPASQP